MTSTASLRAQRISVCVIVDNQSTSFANIKLSEYRRNDGRVLTEGKITVQPKASQFDQDLRNAVAAGEEVLPRLRSALELLVPAHKRFPFYIRYRVKEFTSLKNKIVDRRIGRGGREPQPSYGLQDVTDICGIRIVTLYDSELLEAIGLVRSLISTLRNEDDQKPRLAEPVFKSATVSDAIKEAKFFLREPARLNLPAIEDEKDIYQRCYERLRSLAKEDCKNNAQRKNIEKRIKTPIDPVNSHYSSMHMIVEALSYRSSMGNPVSPYRVPVEIQIRTVSEDIWAEVDHEYKYKVTHRTLWNGRVERIYERLEDASIQLKDRITRIPIDVQRMHRNYAEAADEIQKLKSPRNGWFFSVALTHIEQLVIDKFDQTGAFLIEHKYQRIWTETVSPLDEARINEAIVILEKIPKYIHGMTDDEAWSVNKLLKFESIRLRAIQAQIQCSPADDPDARKIKHEFTNLYEELRELIAEDAGKPWKMKPNTVLQYWRAHLLRPYNPSRSREILELAHEGKNADDNITRWSVYHAVIPRALAELDWASAIYLLPQPGSDSVAKLGTTAFNDAKEHLLNAVAYGKEALDNSMAVRVEDAEFRGDLTLGFGYQEGIADLSHLMAYVTQYITLHKWLAQSRTVDKKELDELKEATGVDFHYFNATFKSIFAATGTTNAHLRTFVRNNAPAVTDFFEAFSLDCDMLQRFIREPSGESVR